MNPALKKKLLERGLRNTEPRQWQDNGWQANRCPSCGKPLFSWYDTSSHERCDECGWHSD